jgi:hypothetical protein
MNMESPIRRILAGSILLILLITLCIYYANGYEKNVDYSFYGAIPAQHSQGALAFVYGTVTDTYEGGYDVQELYNDQVITMHVQSSHPQSSGEVITIIGVLGPDNQIVSIRTLQVTEAWKEFFLLLRSFLALIFLIFIFHRYWYFDPRKFEFRRR